MNKKIFPYLLAAIIITGCKNNVVHISGSLVNPTGGEYLYLDELKSNELVSVDSLKIKDDGFFSFKREIKFPSFYLLKINENNFLTMLIEPGQKIIINAQYDSLNYPVSVTGSIGTESMAGYNGTLRKTINKLTGLNEIYMQNVDSPKLPAVIESLDSTAQVYLNEINSYTKRYIDQNITSLVSLVALYQQVAPGVSVMNPTRDLKYFVKVDSALSILYPYLKLRIFHFQLLKVILLNFHPRGGQLSCSIFGLHGVLHAGRRALTLLMHTIFIIIRDFRSIRCLWTKPGRHGLKGLPMINLGNGYMSVILNTGIQ
jgi:hypothetical protein